MDIETLKQINRMCEIILGNNFQNNELDSLAFYIRHHPDVLNPKADDSKVLLRRCLVRFKAEKVIKEIEPYYDLDLLSLISDIEEYLK